jgi:hypothetical protein
MTGIVFPLAHGLGGRTDLALPGWLFSWGAAVVLAVSFFALAALWNEPKLETARLRPLLRIPRALEPLCGVIGLAIFAALVYFGLAGDQDVDSNPVPTVVYVFFWTMLPLISALFGDVFRPFNPWRAAGLWSHRLRARLARGSQNAAPRFAYPEAFGRWPAVVGLVAFGWLELVSGEQGKRPAVLAVLALAYFAFQVGGMSLFGARRWLERGDAFGTYFDFFSRISPLTVERHRLSLRIPLSGLTDIRSLAGTVAFVSAMIGITVYDGVERGGIWTSIASSDPSRLVATIGLVGSVGLVAGVYRLGVLGMEGSHIAKSPRELSMMFAPSLVPIALGYLVAHYFSFMVFVGQSLPHVLAHPMGDAGSPSIDYFMSSRTIWWIQVAALLAGHVAGLVVAHDKATAVWGKARAAAQSQTWMLVVMVGFTSLGLWLLSQSP